MIQRHYCFLEGAPSTSSCLSNNSWAPIHHSRLRLAPSQARCPSSISSVCRKLRRSALGHGSSVGCSEVLGVTLLAVLLRELSVSFPPIAACSNSQFSNTYRPLGETQVHLATTLGSNSLILLEAAANGAGRNGQVAVVAIKVVMLASSVLRQ